MNPWNLIFLELERLYELESKERTFVHRHARSVPVREMSVEEVREETRSRCREYDQEIAASIESWQWGGSFSMISGPAQMWRYVRLNVAVMQVLTLIETEDSHLVFPPPHLPHDAVIRWLLTDWWQLHGVGLRALIERSL